MKEDFFMNNCLCNLFDNNGIWIALLALCVLCCCCNG